MRKGRGQVCVEQAMEEMFSGFAANGKAAGNVGAEARPRCTESQMAMSSSCTFSLTAILCICCAAAAADVRKVVIENHGALIHAKWQNQIGVHYAGIGIDHKVGIDPQIKSVALARGPDTAESVALGVQRAGLQAGALEILNGVFRIFDDAAQPLWAWGT